MLFPFFPVLLLEAGEWQAAGPSGAASATSCVCGTNALWNVGQVLSFPGSHGATSGQAPEGSRRGQRMQSGHFLLAATPLPLQTSCESWRCTHLLSHIRVTQQVVWCWGILSHITRIFSGFLLTVTFQPPTSFPAWMVACLLQNNILVSSGDDKHERKARSARNVPNTVCFSCLLNIPCLLLYPCGRAREQCYQNRFPSPSPSVMTTAWQRNVGPLGTHAAVLLVGQLGTASTSTHILHSLVNLNDVTGGNFLLMS